MSGMDRMDQNISFHRIPVRAKKWWMSLLMFMPNAAMKNTWLLYRKSDGSNSRPLDLLGFKREIADIYRRKYSS